MGDIELPSPCPICGKRHKAGSGPYKQHLEEYIKGCCPVDDEPCTRKNPCVNECYIEKEKANPDWGETGTTFVDGVVSEVVVPVEAVEDIDDWIQFPAECPACKTFTLEWSKSRDVVRCWDCEYITSTYDTHDIPDIPEEDAIPEDLIPEDLVRDITEKVVDGLIESATVTIDMNDIPVYDVRGTEYEKDYNEQDRIFIDGEPVKRPPDKLKVGTAKLTTDKNGNINAGMTIDMDEIVTREWSSAIAEFHELKPPSGAKHLTVKPGNDVKPYREHLNTTPVTGINPGNDIKTTGIFMEAVIGKDGVISKRRLTDDEIKTLEKFKDEPLLSMFDVLCKKGKRCPKCDKDDCESRVKPYAPSLLSRLKHRLGSFFRGSG